MKTLLNELEECIKSARARDLARDDDMCRMAGEIASLKCQLSFAKADLARAEARADSYKRQATDARFKLHQLESDAVSRREDLTIVKGSNW